MQIMRNFLAVLILTTLCISPVNFAAGLPSGSAGQAAPGSAAPTASPTQSQSSSSADTSAQPTAAKPDSTPSAGPSTSEFLKPSLNSLQQTIGALQLEKWKKGSVRDEAISNISSIQKDLQSTLPALLEAADQAPGTVSKTLPVARNLAALYDVLLRVVDGARIIAPSDQFAQLQQAMAGLEKGRRALDDRMQDRATAQEKQIGDLQVALKNRPAPVCPVTPPPPPPAPAKKVVPKKRKPAAAKPEVKPGTTPPATNAQPAPANKPQQ